VAEAPALIHDHVECGKHTARLRALFEERALLQAMYDVGYFGHGRDLLVVDCSCGSPGSTRVSA
jgi:hypothetical protein